MTDIATKAGVSRSAVSHVLNDRKYENIRVNENTRQRILDTAAELGYRTNQLARSVASGKTRMIGYLVEEPRYEPHWNTLIGALDEAGELGFTLKVVAVTDENLADRVRQCIELRLGGLIVRVVGDKSLIFDEANRAQIPVVTLDEGVMQPFGANVVADDATGCRAAIEHLVSLGHNRISFVSSGFSQFGSEDIGSARERLFLQEMQSRGMAVPEGYVIQETMQVYGSLTEAPIDMATIHQAVDALVNHPQGRPTAIFCWRDETAMVVVRACRLHGLRVPEDISVIGFSNVSTARFFDPPLSTVTSPWEGMGRMAMRQISQRMSEEFNSTPSTHLVDTGFIVRESTGPASV